MDLLPANAPDSQRALELVEASEANTGAEVDETIGDCSCGDGTTREIFEQAGRNLVVRVRRRDNQGRFTKEAFAIDLEAGTCTCPAGEVTHTAVPCGMRKGRTGRTFSVRAFQFEGEVRERCAFRAACLRARPGQGSTVMIDPQERLLQQASPEFAQYRTKRRAAEHRLARLVQLGIRRSCYFGQVKALFQLILASTVANLTLTPSKANKIRSGCKAKCLSSLSLSLLKRAIEAIRTDRSGLPFAIRAIFP